MSRTSNRGADRPRHEPTDPDIAEAMRDRRIELDLTVQEIAERAGVSEQTWRNYERGRTQVRGDKQLGVWEALDWEPPRQWAPITMLENALGILADGQGEGPQSAADAFDYPWDGPGPLPAEAALEGLGLPDWDEIPDALGSYSPLVKRTLGEDAARCFALGAHLYDRLLTEDLEALTEMPRGTHVGELDVSHVSGTLPALWLTRYDYEFLFQLRGLGQITTHRLVEAMIAPDEPLVRTLAEAVVVHDIFTLGGMTASSLGKELEDEEWEGWVNAFSGPQEPAHLLLSTILVPPPDAAIHIDHWFDPLTEPFVPHWNIEGAAAEGETDSGATVTRLHRD